MPFKLFGINAAQQYSLAFRVRIVSRAKAEARTT
jgi:hypothetical protein